MSPELELRSGLTALGLSPTERHVEQLMGYAQLLQKWTRVYNLTALRDPAEIVRHHLLDCAAVVNPLRHMRKVDAVRLLDVGSGGGLPGVVIAVLCPDVTVDCVDAVAKKAAFVQQVSAAIQAPNLRGLHSRVENLEGQYDVAVSRAFASLRDFVTLTDRTLTDGGMWLAMKGKYPAEEVAELPPGREVFHVEQLQVPGLAAERCLLWLRRAAA